MVASYPGSEAVVNALALPVGFSPAHRGLSAQPETALATAVREAVTAVLLWDFPQGLVVSEASIRSLHREHATVRAGRADELARRLAERGGWDEV